MRFSLSATVALMAGQAAFAAPVAESASDIVEVQESVNEAHLALATLENDLEKRLSCRLLDTTVRSIGTSKTTVTWIYGLTAASRAICALTSADNCDSIAYAMQSVFYLVYLAAAQYSGALPEGLPSKRDVDVQDAYLQWWLSSIGNSTVSYESITSISFDPVAENLKKRDGDPSLVARVQLSGVRPADTGDKVDLIADHFEDGMTVLNMPVGQDVGSLAKRYDGAGIKISYTTRVRSLLSQAHQTEMANYLASAWQYLAINENMDEMIGFAETESYANFYYRVIPETKGFGLNYESVDVCGGMASYL